VLAYKNCWGLKQTLESSQAAIIELDRLLSFIHPLSYLVTPAKKCFHGLVFIFGMHPFHVGDHVVIDNNQYDTREVVFYPNSVLASKSISNLEIAPDQGDSLEFTIDVETPTEEIADLENRIKKRISKYGNFEKSKLLMQENDGKEIKMAFHLKPSEVQEDHQQQDEIINPVETTDELITKIKSMIDEIIEQVLGSVFC
ncbi:hypothetical protein Ancab_031467, partial [Ancistrocladus abbreviatus]